MKILHIEASPGWGGQELRILQEADGMRSRGHQVILAVQEGGGLVAPAREKGILVFEVSFKKTKILSAFYQLMRIIRKHEIEIVNTHSSMDAWIGGLAGKISGCRVIRTRHLSTPVKRGLNSLLLYNLLAHYVVTTCEEVVDVIRRQAKLPMHRCLSIPTGVDPALITYNPSEVEAFRAQLGLKPEDCVVGTLCVLRGWKGVSDFLKAAKILEHVPNLKWLVVGSGPSEQQLREEWTSLKLEDKVIFTGHISPPYTALASMDIFALLSWAHEGVSQASLQAAWLEKPLITTPIGGLGEICLENETGFQVPIHAPERVASAVLNLLNNQEMRRKFGRNAKILVQKKFTLQQTLDKMEAIYK